MSAYQATFESAIQPRLRISSGIRRLALAYVWLTIAVGGIVFAEPAPYDALMMGAILMLPVVGLVAFPPPLALYLLLWVLVIAGGLIASTQAAGMETPAKHIAITLYLAVSSVILAGFVAKQPDKHLRLILSGYMVAAVIAATAALIGYFSLVPGAFDLFTEYGRARGTFKDPNVLGTFLVPALLYAFNAVLTARPGRATLSFAVTPMLMFAALLTFSRGAWINLFVAMGFYAYFTFAAASSNRRRLKLLLSVALGVGLVLAVFALAGEMPRIAEVLGERISAQAYDVGPEGRFGGHIKALGLILTHPLGIGALEFAGRYAAEDVHNVYLSMFLNSGWIGGFAYLVLVVLTLALGLGHVIRNGAGSGLMVVLLAAFFGQAFEGIVIDSDHWRHFYLLMGLIWGAASASLWASRKALPERPYFRATM